MTGGVVDSRTSSKGIKRSFRFHYRDIGDDLRGVSAGVLLELGTRGGALGSTRAMVHSIDNPDAAIRGARHYYDVYRLLSRPEVRSGIDETGIAALARDVITYSRAAGLDATTRPLMNVEKL